jgi:hypothetical protein
MYLILNREGIIITLKSLFVTMQRRNIDEYDKRLRHDTPKHKSKMLAFLQISYIQLVIQNGPMWG